MTNKNDKSFRLITARYQDTGKTLMVNRSEDSLTVLKKIEGVGANSYPIFRLTVGKKNGLRGWLGQIEIKDECLDVAFSLASAKKVFAAAIR